MQNADPMDAMSCYCSDHSIDFHSAATSVTRVGTCVSTFSRNVVHRPFSLDTLLSDFAATFIDMWFEALVEIHRAPGSRCNSNEHKSEGYDRKDRQCRPSDLVLIQTITFYGVHANELEDEVCGSE